MCWTSARAGSRECSRERIDSREPSAKLKPVRAVIGLLMGSFVSLTIHAYLWWRLIRSAHLQRRTRRILTAALVVAFLSVPVTTAARLAWPSFAAIIGWFTLTWIAFAGLTFVTLVALDVLRALGWGVDRVRNAPPRDPSRRQFLARATGGAAVAVAGASVAAGMLTARGEHEVVDVEVHLAKLPRALDGFTIVQLSDLHVGMTIGRGFVERVVARTMALEPDLIALTGDLVDGTVPDLRDDVAPLGGLRAPHGVFATTGNHEYYAGVEPWLVELTRLGARYLRNETVTITRNGASFELVGIDDFSAEGHPGHGADLHRALATHDPALATVLMAHQPRQVMRARDHGIDFQMSGHTHGGQIWPWHYLVRIQQGGLLAGRYQIGDTQLYVTRGCGYWGPPVRVLAPLEITRFILRSGVA